MFKKLSVRIVLPFAVLIAIIYACDYNSNDSEIDLTAQSSSSEDEIEYEEAVVAISNHLSIDSEQTLVALTQSSQWLSTQLELSPEIAQELNQRVEGSKSVAVYTWNNLNEGWDQYLLSLTADLELVVVRGGLLHPSSINYTISENGKKEPTKAKDPTIIKLPYGPFKKGCKVKQCTMEICLNHSYYPCNGQVPNCTNDYDCWQGSGTIGIIQAIGIF